MAIFKGLRFTHQSTATDDNSANTEDNAQSVEHGIPPKKQTKIRWFKLSALILIVVLIVGGGWYSHLLNNRKPSAIAAKMIASIIKNDSETAYRLTSAAFQQNSTKEKLASSLNQISPFLKGGSYKQTDHYSWLKNGQVYSTSLVYQIAANGKTYYIRLLLDKNDQGDWQISVFRVSETALKALEN